MLIKGMALKKKPQEFICYCHISQGRQARHISNLWMMASAQNKSWMPLKVTASLKAMIL